MKKEVCSLIQRSSSMSTLFSICDLLKLASEKLVDLGSFENTGLSEEEKEGLKELGFDVLGFKDNIAHIAVSIIDELEDKCGR